MLKLVILGLTVAVTCAAPADEDNTGAPFKFGVDLYNTVREGSPDQNFVLSPLSVQTALGLILMGAEGATAEQLVRGLKLKNNGRTQLASHFQRALERYSTDDKLKVANKVYVKTGYELNSEFSALAKNQFGSEAESLNFAESASAANTINSWVEDHTNKKIKDLVSADSLDSDTRLVLVNAVHFKAAWKNAFYTRSTAKRDFWNSETEAVQVDTMFGNMYLKHGRVKELDAEVLLLPYGNTSLSMMILLPNSRAGLAELEAKLPNFDFASLTNDLSPGRVEVFMPKFKIESNVDLKTVLPKMGMTDMFTGNADFPSLINSGEHLVVDQAVHKTYISVDEEGTEAAAATQLTAVPISIPPLIEVDHPFLFAIMNSDDVAFLGCVRRL